MWRLVTGGAYVLWTDDRDLAKAVLAEVKGSTRGCVYAGEHSVVFPESREAEVKTICEEWDEKV